MRTYRSILVPLDGSEFAEQALPLAVEMARQNGAILQVALVHQPLPAFAAAMELPMVEAELDTEARRREQEYLNLMVRRLGSEASLPVTSILLDGPVAEAIESQVQSSAADLVVISTHGRGAMGRFWIGSVTDRLMRRLCVPVMVVRPGVDGKALPIRVRRILVALDGSAFAETILEEAVGYGRAFGAEYALVSVVEPPLPVMDMVPLTAIPDTLTLERKLLGAAERYLTRIAEGLRAQGHVASAHAVAGTRVSETLLDQANRLGADMIAIATHGAGGLKRLALGSVTDQVVRGSLHPVLVLAPRKGAVKLEATDGELLSPSHLGALH